MNVLNITTHVQHFSDVVSLITETFARTMKLDIDPDDYIVIKDTIPVHEIPRYIASAGYIYFAWVKNCSTDVDDVIQLSYEDDPTFDDGLFAILFPGQVSYFFPLADTDKIYLKNSVSVHVQVEYFLLCEL